MLLLAFALLFLIKEMVGLKIILGRIEFCSVFMRRVMSRFLMKISWLMSEK
jgi:hypothetical protein